MTQSTTTNPESIQSIQDSSERLNSTQRRAQALARTIGRDHTMKVEVSSSDDGSYWDWKNNEVVIGRNHAERDVEETLGIISHEGMHRKISRFSVIPNEILHDPGFNMLAQHVEDVRVNTALQRMFPGAGDWVKKAVDSDIVTGAKETIDEYMKELGFVPYQYEFCRGLHSKFILGEYPDELTEIVLESLKATEEYIHQVSTNIPDVNSDENTIIKCAEKGYITLRKEVWPIFKELVDRDNEDVALTLYLIRIATNDAGDLEKLLEVVDEKELDELETFVKVMEERNNQSQTDSESTLYPKDKTFFNSVRNMSTSLRKKILDTVKEEKKDPERSGNSTDDSESSDTSKLPKSLSKAAEKILKDIEDNVTERIRPKMINPEEFETHAESEISKGKSDEEKEYIRSIREEEKRRSEKLSTYYDKAYKEVAPLIDNLVYELEQILYPTKASRWKKGYPNGSRVSLDRAMQYEADPRKYNKLFDRKTLADIREYNFTLLVDLSGSMSQGNRNIEALKSTILFSEVLDRIGIKFEILGFHTLPINDLDKELYVFKNYVSKYNNDAKKQLNRIITETDSSWASDNDDGPAVLWASTRLDNQTGKKFLFVISDGEPDYSEPYRRYGYTDHDEYELESVVKKVMQKDQYIVGLGIGEGVNSVKKYYPNNVIVPNVRELAPEVGKIIKDIIETPSEYVM